MGESIKIRSRTKEPWAEPDLAALSTEVLEIRLGLIENTGSFGLWIVDAKDMQDIAAAEGWRVGAFNGVIEPHGVCMASGSAVGGNVQSTILLPTGRARRLAERNQKGTPLNQLGSEDRYSRYVIAHEMGHGVDYHYRFSGSQTKIQPSRPFKVALLESLASKLITELCADGYASTTISQLTYQERVAAQNKMTNVWWDDLKKFFEQHPEAANAEARSFEVALFLMNLMEAHVHSVALPIGDNRLKIVDALWGLKNRSLDKPRREMTALLRAAWGQRRTFDPSTIAWRVREIGLFFGSRLGFRLRKSDKPEEPDIFDGPVGGFL